MALEIHPNALKHGLTPDQVVEAYETGFLTARVRSRDRHSEPERWATIGVDQAGREIELVFVKCVDRILIFHARYKTKGFEKELRP